MAKLDGVKKKKKKKKKKRNSRALHGPQIFLFVEYVFSYFKVTTKRPAADQQADHNWCLINLAFSNHHDLPKIKSIDI